MYIHLIFLFEFLLVPLHLSLWMTEQPSKWSLVCIAIALHDLMFGFSVIWCNSNENSVWFFVMAHHIYPADTVSQTHRRTFVAYRLLSHMAIRTTSQHLKGTGNWQCLISSTQSEFLWDRRAFYFHFGGFVRLANKKNCVYFFVCFGFVITNSIKMIFSVWWFLLRQNAFEHFGFVCYLVRSWCLHILVDLFAKVLHVTKLNIVYNVCAVRAQNHHQNGNKNRNKIWNEETKIRTFTESLFKYVDLNDWATIPQNLKQNSYDTTNPEMNCKPLFTKHSEIKTN